MIPALCQPHVEPEPHGRPIAALMRFVVLAGIGAQTTHGFGAVNLVRLTEHESGAGRGSTQPVQPQAGMPENPSVLADTKAQVNPHDHDKGARRNDLRAVLDTRSSHTLHSAQVSRPENHEPSLTQARPKGHRNLLESVTPVWVPTLLTKLDQGLGIQ